MLTVTDNATKELQSFLAGDKAKGAKLVIYFQGVG